MSRGGRTRPDGVPAPDGHCAGAGEWEAPALDRTPPHAPGRTPQAHADPSAYPD